MVIENDSPACVPPQKRPLRILFIEDSRADFELCLSQLKKANFEVVPDIAQSEREFVEKIERTSYDVILADYELAGWTGLDALKVLQERGESPPFIMVTGVLDDEVVVECVKQGLSDYVLKDRISRLPIAIRRAIEERTLLNEKRAALNQLREAEGKFRTLTEMVASAIFVYRLGKCEYANCAAEAITGYTRKQLLDLTFLDLAYRGSEQSAIQITRAIETGVAGSQRYELRIVTKSGELRWLDMTSRLIESHGEKAELITAFDITDRKQADEEIKHLVTSDPLTGLANYRHLLDAFACEHERSGRTGRPFSLVLLDVDRLKCINDSFGHLVGSRAICRVGHVLRTQCRSLDIPARYGGDEFAIVLPETDARAAEHLARRVARKVLQDREKPGISVSFGIGVFPDNGNTFRDVFGIADIGLYSMKGQVVSQASRLSLNR